MHWAVALDQTLVSAGVAIVAAAIAYVRAAHVLRRQAEKRDLVQRRDALRLLGALAALGLCLFVVLRSLEAARLARDRVGTFLVFGLGFGLPLVILSLLAGARQRTVVRFVLDHHRAIEIVSGVVLILVATWDLRENWDGILFTLGL